MEIEDRTEAEKELLEDSYTVMITYGITGTRFSIDGAEKMMLSRYAIARDLVGIAISLER